MKFSHLNRHQRYQIEWRTQRGHSAQTIAASLGVHRSTVYRELKRGTTQAGGYRTGQAQQRAQLRRRASTANHPQKSAALWKVVRHHLRQDHSPEQFAGRLHAMGGLAGERVSCQAIYDWIKRKKHPLASHLRRHGNSQRWCRPRGGLAKNRPRLKDRPKSVAGRRSKRHWEGDMIGGARGGDAHRSHRRATRAAWA